MIGGDFDTPVMYQDLANYTMGPMNIPFGVMSGNMYAGGMIGNTSYLGGVKMKPQLANDELQLINKKNEAGKSTFKKVMLGIGACLLLGFIPVISKGIKNSGGVWNYIKGLFTKTPPAPKKPSLWQKFKNLFNSGQQTANNISKWAKFKGWCNGKFTAFKNLFKKNAPVQNP